MDFIPLNRHLYVIPIEEKDETQTPMIVLPDDYKEPASPYTVCDVLIAADDCDLDVDVGDRIIVENRMLHQINVNGETIYIVLQNYVYGRIDYEDN
jgi:co-chaperonin GroES (HSP10)